MPESLRPVGPCNQKSENAHSTPDRPEPLNTKPRSPDMNVPGFRWPPRPSTTGGRDLPTGGDIQSNIGMIDRMAVFGQCRLMVRNRCCVRDADSVPLLLRLLPLPHLFLPLVLLVMQQDNDDDDDDDDSDLDDGHAADAGNAGVTMTTMTVAAMMLMVLTMISEDFDVNKKMWIPCMNTWHTGANFMKTFDKEDLICLFILRTGSRRRDVWAWLSGFFGQDCLNSRFGRKLDFGFVTARQTTKPDEAVVSRLGDACASASEASGGDALCAIHSYVMSLGTALASGLKADGSWVLAHASQESRYL